MTASNDRRHPDPERGALPAASGNAGEPALDAPAVGSNVLPPIAGIVELVVLTGLIVAFGLMMPDIDLAEVQPSPFWLPVLLLSLQYGTVSGILAAATALLVMLMSGLPEPGVGENYFSYAMRVFAQPILWFGAAVVLGQFRMRQIQAKNGLTAMVLDLEAQRAALAGYARNLRRRCDMLERDRASSGEAGGVALLAGLAQLAAAGGHAADIGPAFARTMNAAFPGSRASLLAVDPSGLVVITSTGRQPASPEVLDAAHPLYRAVVGEGRALSVLDPGNEAVLAGQGLAAVPIRDSSGSVIGAVRLETADATTLTHATLPALGVVATALGSALAVATGDDSGCIGRPQLADLASPASRADGHDRGAAPNGSGPLRRTLTSISWLNHRRTDGAAGDGVASEPTRKSKASS